MGTTSDAAAGAATVSGRRLGELLTQIDVAKADASWERATVTSVACRLDGVTPGCLWFAVPPGTTPGRVRQAVERGAVAVVTATDDLVPQLGGIPVVVVPDAREAMALASAAFFDWPARQLRLVGTTGTNGKGTTSLLLRSMLEADENTGPAAYIGTDGRGVTTPEPPDLHARLAGLRDDGVTDVCLEVSSHGLAWKRTLGLSFVAAVFTNLDHDHLDLHGSVEEYFAAKRRLFEASCCDLAVVNRDDPWGVRLLAELDVPSLTYSLGDVGALRRVDGAFVFRWHGLDLRLPLPGMFNLSNALAAATTAEALGVPGRTICAALDAATLAVGRFERVDAGQDFEIIIDYAHTPGAVAAVLSAARKPGRRLVALVAGEGGGDRTKRPLIGLAASRLADVVVVTSEHPRWEEPADLAAEVFGGIPLGVAAHVIPDRAEAISFALAQAGPGDVVVLTGKGQELTHCVGNEAAAFDERQVVRQALLARPAPPRARPGPTSRPAALEHREHGGVRVLTDADARERGVLVAFGDRRGGVSRPPFDELNLNMEGGDRVADAVENRRRVAAAAGFDPGAILLFRPVHGIALETVVAGQIEDDRAADGMVTAAPGMVLGLLTADCAAVVLAGERSVAILHGGWRGLADGIVAAGVDAVGPVWRAWVGPAIRDCCYEVGDEVVSAFRAKGLPVGSGRVDIARAAEVALRSAGVEHVIVADVCTACDRDYFSYRRDGVTGRQGAFVSILDP